jgi:hypothetical protein
VSSHLRLSTIGLLVALVVACTAHSDRPSTEQATKELGKSYQHWCEEVDSTGVCTLYGPSLITLIAQPEKFDGKPVRVIGYVHFQFEGDGLYVSQADFEHSIFRNGLWIDPPSGFESDSAPARRQPNDQYVIVEGIFSAQDGGHFGMWSGALHHVTRLELWSRATPPKINHIP